VKTKSEIDVRSSKSEEKLPATLADLGEDRLIAELTHRLASGPDVLVGAGDDCAVIGRPRAARWQLLKTDAVVEGVHFLPEERSAPRGLEGALPGDQRHRRHGRGARACAHHSRGARHDAGRPGQRHLRGLAEGRPRAMG